MMLFIYLFIYCNFCFFSALKVPSPNVNLTTSKIQIVGQSLMLECSVTTVRGITSRVDIVWSSNGIELEKSEGHIINTTVRNSVVYIDTYFVAKLSTTNEGQQYQCEVIISGQIPVMASDIIVLDVSGEIIH